VDRVALEAAARIVTYVPRPTAIKRYEAASDHGRAGIRSTYWGLVDAAFAVWGADQLERYRSSTPRPTYRWWRLPTRRHSRSAPGRRSPTAAPV
jgi:hypothetical protein